MHLMIFFPEFGSSVYLQFNPGKGGPCLPKRVFRAKHHPSPFCQERCKQKIPEFLNDFLMNVYYRTLMKLFYALVLLKSVTFGRESKSQL